MKAQCKGLLINSPLAIVGCLLLFHRPHAGIGQDLVRKARVAQTITSKSSLRLNYIQFDQTPHAGWRYLADKGKYYRAARLVEQYIKHHSQLKQWQVINLHFHAGQLYAFDHRYKRAVAHFKQSLSTTEPPQSPIKWNAYVRATIAFLRNDKKGLTRYRQEIARGPKWQGSIPNLDVVNSLLANLGKPYMVAYRARSKKAAQKKIGEKTPDRKQP